MRLSVLAASTTLAAALILSGCTTVAKYSLRNDLERIGLSQKMSSCMADQLEDRLDDRELQELAWHVSRLSRASDSGKAMSALKQIDNPGVIAGITASALSCALAPNN